MTASRDEHKAVSGEYKTRDPLLQAVRLPNGNFVCKHVSRQGALCLAIFDPLKNKTIARSRNWTLEMTPDPAHSFIHPLSNDTFLYHITNKKVYLFELRNKDINCIQGTKNYYYRVKVGADNMLIGLNIGFPHSAIETIDIETLKVKQFTPWDGRLGWNALPSGMIFKYPYDEPIDQSKVLIFKTPHDEEPIKELEFKAENINFGESSGALSNKVVFYHVKQNFVIFHNILTNKTRECPELKSFIFADLGDNRILISTGKKFFLLDEDSLELTKIHLGFDTDKSCINISCSNGVIALAFEKSEMLHVTHAAELTPKHIVVSNIMESVQCMPAPLARIIESYRGLSLFNRPALLGLDDKAKHTTHITLEKR